MTSLNIQKAQDFGNPLELCNYSFQIDEFLMTITIDLENGGEQVFSYELITEKSESDIQSNGWQESYIYTMKVYVDGNELNYSWHNIGHISQMIVNDLAIVYDRKIKMKGAFSKLQDWTSNKTTELLN